jgi:GT2 family glycosyltransferase/glycosyltransferase involved in cell wall biosynthesis
METESLSGEALERLEAADTVEGAEPAHEAVIPLDPNLSDTDDDDATPAPRLKRRSGLKKLDLSGLQPAHDIAEAPALNTASYSANVTALFGSVDMISESEITGWAWNPNAPEETCLVEILDGDEVLVRVAADVLRPDLVKSSLGTGRYGFSVTGVGALLPHARHLVHVRFAQTKADLRNSPQMIQKASRGFDASAQRFVEGSIISSASSAKSVHEIDEPLAVLLGLVNQLVNARASLSTSFARGKDVSVLEDVGLRELSDWTRELAMRIVTTYPPIALPEAKNPEVSIIIPVHGKFAYTYNCIKSIANALPNVSFEAIIVDDCSSDETIFASFVLSGGARVVRLAKNQGFIGACNAGALEARGEYLFFLNNDTLVRDGWLDTLVDTFDEVPNVGIVGSKLFFEDGVLQEVGGIIWRMGDGWNWGRGADAKMPKFNFLRDADYVSGAALMIPRKLFEQLGQFDDHYRPAYYEDTDLCFKVRAAGKRVVVQPASEIVHLEGVSNGTDTAGTGLKRYQVVNHRKFLLRWQETLSQHRLNAQEPELECERNVRSRAYFIDETILTPEQDAGSNAALQHIKALQRLGYKVTFLPSDNMARQDPHTRQLEKIGVECLYAPFYWSVEEVFRKCGIQPDLFYLHRYVNASKYALMIREHFPKARIIYNVADVHFLREERQAAVEGDAALAKRAIVRRERELSAMRQVDCVIVHSTVEADLLRELLPGKAIQVVPWAVKINPAKLGFAQRSGYAFVGGFRHVPNVDAVTYFAEHILPKVGAEGHVLQVIGSHTPDSVRRLHGPKVNVRGQVAELADVFHRVRCTIAPLRYGAGIKGKVLDSFAHGLPCVMTEVAAEGLPLTKQLQWLVARDETEFAKKVVRLLEDEKWSQTLADEGIRMLINSFSEVATELALAASINT